MAVLGDDVRVLPEVFHVAARPPPAHPGLGAQRHAGFQHRVVGGDDAGRLGHAHPLAVAHPELGPPVVRVQLHVHVLDRVRADPVQLGAAQARPDRIGHLPVDVLHGLVDATLLVGGPAKDRKPRVVDRVHAVPGAAVHPDHHAPLQRAIVRILVLVARAIALDVDEGRAVRAFLQHQPLERPNGLPLGDARLDLGVVEPLSGAAGDRGRRAHEVDLDGRLHHPQLDDDVRGVDELAPGNALTRSR